MGLFWGTSARGLGYPSLRKRTLGGRGRGGRARSMRRRTGWKGGCARYDGLKSAF
jgi:hypothetical protein